MEEGGRQGERGGRGEGHTISIADRPNESPLPNSDAQPAVPGAMACHCHRPYPNSLHRQGGDRRVSHVSSGGRISPPFSHLPLSHPPFAHPPCSKIPLSHPPFPHHPSVTLHFSSFLPTPNSLHPPYLHAPLPRALCLLSLPILLPLLTLPSREAVRLSMQDGQHAFHHKITPPSCCHLFTSLHFPST